MGQYDIALIGGDTRTAFMLSYFMEQNYRVICYGIEKIPQNDNLAVYAGSLQEAVEQSSCIVGGIPFIKCGKIFSGQELPDLSIDVLFECMTEGKVIFAGMLSKEFAETCRNKNIVCHDFMKDEALAIFNSIATAEGTVLEALLHKETNIHGSNSLVLGYGRCGTALAEKLKGMGAKVTVCSRCDVELAKANTAGLNTLPADILKDEIHQYEYIYNTIPSVILTEDILLKIDRDALVIDIASEPGGIDKAAAYKLGVKTLHCLGLPGKYAPKISAKGLTDFVVNRLQLR